ncbi:Protein kinase subdomain-containing protein PKL/CAK/Fmp29 [Mycena sanguinolenta]|uniref:Protein kinase subdomain-containing protein PKL/CAK/Fmp29 n=1 Tax=Mycena sanguinolenta TaxID=230812 RepID=A0A8H6YRV0_9AGAR|nr:Protein kinase subdomain-containing protein PKL/CAK/Fmp29 [Mycena sanguinolenta]
MSCRRASDSFLRRSRPFSSPRSVSSSTPLSVSRSLHDLFHYTSGRWIINDALRHAERRRIFNVDGLRRLAALSVARSPDDIVDFAKLAEGGFNRTFLITMRGGFQMVARIPYPATVPKYYAVASEVATMAFLRSSGLPIPKVYGYSPVSDNAAETEYIFMEFVRGPTLSDVWLDLEERDTISVLRQLIQFESKMMSISFPAGGSLYYAQDLEKAGIPLEDERFCVGPDTRTSLWYGRRSQLDVDRGPYERPEAALTKVAHKELAYLERFGQPLLPFRRLRREAYEFQEQSPADHVENLNQYLISPSLIPKDSTLSNFHIRHPDLQQSNIIVSKAPDSDWRIAALLDWQHTSILPAFLLAGVPDRLQNYDDPMSQLMIPPSLPDDLHALNETEQRRAKELYRRRLVHYHYIKNTEKLNKLHHAALTDPASLLCRRLFDQASLPWDGETLALKVALIDATESWELSTPRPVAFDPEDVRETMRLDAEQRDADASLEHYETAMAYCKKMKEEMLAGLTTAEDHALIEAHWVLDDFDEEKYK